MKKRIFAGLLLVSPWCVASEIEQVAVEGRNDNLVGVAVSASEGVVGQREMALRPSLRTGDILEVVPGMVVTQHSGSGKANQYFLRGFNLDHGTDFANYVDGMPVNMRSHGHGQGYSDLNFLIPETVRKIRYRKGAYYADVGDFSGAGSARIETVSATEEGLLSATVGENAFYRWLLMNSFDFAGGETLFALEGNRYDGPWSDIEEDLDKINGLLKHRFHLGEGHMQVSLMAYDNRWNSADQIPLRAAEQGIIDELGSIDDSVGGETSRYSLNADWRQGAWHSSAYLIDYRLNLWSNFTYFLDDESNGDQFEQVDERKIWGGQLSYQFENILGGHAVVNRLGMDLRFDDINEVALYQTQARQRLGVTRRDAIEESSVGLYWENRILWNDRWRTVLAARYDAFDFKVTDRAGVNRNGVDLGVNSGDTRDDILSLKGSAIVNFTEQFEGYVSAGQGFHSNDARGTVININPADGSPLVAADPLVRSVGCEMGLRLFRKDQFNVSVALWHLALDSELLFVGDAGNTEASGKSQRQGLETTGYYHFTRHWRLDVEYAYTDAEFSDAPAQSNQIPGAIEHVLQAGISADLPSGWFGSLRQRFFGERPLVEDGSVMSDSSSIWNLRAGYQFDHWLLRGDILNLSDSNDHDIDYFYASRLSSEPSGVATEDIHYHVIEPRTLRLTLERRF